MKIKAQIIEKLIDTFVVSGDEFGLETVCEALESFEAYHLSIYSMEIKMKTYLVKNMEREEYQYMVETMDKNRTRHHNAVLANVNILNRMAQGADLDPVYDGIVSEERPYRREVANAVLEYVEEIIKNRR